MKKMFEIVHGDDDDDNVHRNMVYFMFHFMFVHYTYTSFWVAEWPPFGK